jgi:ubiquinone/menaquinone biosynthesis C-methylase UbiE
MIPPLSEDARIMDIGCGPGQQTLHLSKLCQARIYAVDNHQPYLIKLLKNIRKRNLTDRIFLLNQDMHNLPFSPDSFDLVWSEGAIYIMGFSAGLTSWRKLLKPGGFLAVSELSWIDKNPPSQLVQYWKKAYPDMKSIDENLNCIRNCGFNLIGHFILPEKAWWDDYYQPMERKIQSLIRKYSSENQLKEILHAELEEIDMYRNFSRYYGYVFYVMQKDTPELKPYRYIFL